MTRADHKTIFTALGFLAVVMNDVPPDNQAMRATAIAKLIESFCKVSVPEAFEGAETESSRATEVEGLLERYIAELRETGSARLNYDRQTLLGMYEVLLIQKARHEHNAFYASGPDDAIGNRVLHLAEERIQREESA
jgi:hypothetical protein